MNILLYASTKYVSTFMLSREKGLITKEYIVTHMLLKFAFKRALHISTSAIKLVNSGTKLF